MVCLEWWAFEIGTVVTGVLGRIPLAVNSVFLTTLAVVYMVGCSGLASNKYSMSRKYLKLRLFPPPSLSLTHTHTHTHTTGCCALHLQLPLGIGVTATVRVGNELGAGNGKAAKRAAYISLALCGETSYMYM